LAQNYKAVSISLLCWVVARKDVSVIDYCKIDHYVDMITAKRHW